MKTVTRWIIVVMLAAMLLASCSPAVTTTEPEPTAVATAATEPVTLNVWVFEGESEFFPQLIESFQAENPTITVEVTEIPEGDYNTKIDTALLAGEGPDIALIFNPRWIQAGKVLPLDDAFKAYNVPVEDFNKGAITRDCLYEGKYYCVGTYTGAIILVYNKDLFDQFGVAYPSATEPMSMQEYFDMTLKLSKKSDKLEERIWGGDAVPYYWWMDWRTELNSDGRKIEGYINDDATVKAHQLMADMRTVGSAMTTSEGSMVQLEGTDLLVQGKLATTIVDNVISIPAAEKAGMNWGVAIVPTEQKGDQPWTTTWTDSIGVFSTSKHPNEAIKFVAFMGTKGNELRLEFGDMPLNMKMAEKWAGDSEPRNQALQAIGLARENLFCPGFFDAAGLIWDSWTSIVDEGVSAKDALDAVAPEMQTVLDQTWATFEEASTN